MTAAPRLTAAGRRNLATARAIADARAAADGHVLAWDTTFTTIRTGSIELRRAQDARCDACQRLRVVIWADDPDGSLLCWQSVRQGPCVPR